MSVYVKWDALQNDRLGFFSILAVFQNDYLHRVVSKYISRFQKDLDENAQYAMLLCQIYFMFGMFMFGYIITRSHFT